MNRAAACNFGLLCLACGCGSTPADLDTRTTLAIGPAAASAIAQPEYSAVVRWVTRIDDSRLITDLYYPVIPDEGSAVLPVVVVMQGANVERDKYVGFASRLAAYGFTVAVPNHESLLGVLADLSSIDDAVEHLRAEAADPLSPLFERLDTSVLALVGHSFGGVAVLDAINGTCRFPFCRDTFERPENLAAVSLFGTSQCTDGNCETTPIKNAGVPLQLIQGSLDGLVDLAGTTETFERVTNDPKQLLTVSGANHFGINDCNNPDGSNSDPNLPTLDQSESVETTARWSAMFLRAHLLDDADAQSYVREIGAYEDPNASSQYVE